MQLLQLFFVCIAVKISFCRITVNIEGLVSGVRNSRTAKPTLPPQTPTVQTTTNPGEINSQNCTCVAYYQCGENRKVIEDGAGLIDIRLRNCPHYLDICCNKVEDEPFSPTSPETSRNKCGQRNFNGIGFRITGAENNEANFGEFPWMVAILQEEFVAEEMPPINVYKCGGSLIHPQVVLTAAHCITGIDQMNLKIRAGEWDTQTTKEMYPHQDRKVKETIVHENYYNHTLHNDIALLIMETPFEITKNVDLICLPDEGEVMDGRQCAANGWGKDVFGKEGRYQVIMKRIELPIVSRSLCVQELRKTRLGRYFKLHESFICAGGELGKDTCKGDGGSPLICPSQNNPKIYRQAGIVSWGIDCGKATPAVYVNVPFFRGWITSKLSSYNIDIEN